MARVYLAIFFLTSFNCQNFLGYYVFYIFAKSNAMELDKFELKQGFLYKAVHDDVKVGCRYPDFTAKSNIIIFSPLRDLSINPNRNTKIDCEMVVCFSNDLDFGATTTIGKYAGRLDLLDENDIRRLVEVFKKNNKLHVLANLLLSTDYRYNRQLDKVWKIVQTT